VDDRDQMLHFRQFKVLYWTRAKLTAFVNNDKTSIVSGEHYGYERHEGGCIHRRSVIFAKDDLWIVLDRIDGDGRRPHVGRIHWQAEGWQHFWDPDRCALTLETPDGPISIQVLSGSGVPAAGDVATGQEAPPRGWISRYYGERRPAPSLAATA